ncbi:MAG: aldose 1-epimerase family protein, partial [Deltaproteobacteria bacterium]|nr:aldose 1-epimerase family protein [Deltaproteobacteria bacterium]
HPAFIELNDRGGLGRLKGFNEWIVRCGLSSNGAPGNDVIVDNNGNKAEVFLPLHGKIANIPARFVEVQVEVGAPTILRIRGIVEETMLFGPALRLTTEISTELGSNKLTIVDEVTNLNTTPEEIEMLYHCNYGPPFLEEGSKLVAPVKSVAPRDQRAREDLKTLSDFRGPTNGYVEQVYFYELLGDSSGESKVMLRNKAGDLGTSMSFSLEKMPCFSLWKNTASLKNGYVTGLEPGSNFPNPKCFERENGRVVLLEPLMSRKFGISLEVYVGGEAVNEVEKEINKLQGSTSPEILEFAPKNLSAAT